LNIVLLRAKTLNIVLFVPEFIVLLRAQNFESRLIVPFYVAVHLQRLLGDLAICGSSCGKLQGDATYIGIYASS
jgi:hypothetical protein